MLGWECSSSVQGDERSDLSSCLDAELIDHQSTVHHKRDHIPEPSKLSWDPRKGQWIPIAFSYNFPRGPFDHTSKKAGRIVPRMLANFSFPPSKRHAVMLQGSPRHRIIVSQTTLKGRHPPKSPLTRFPIQDHNDDDEEDEDDVTDIDDKGYVSLRGREPVDPFNMEQAKPMPWLDEINIEDFLSSAMDYQQEQDCRAALLLSEPMFGRGRRTSPCTPSSPPPPLFVDDDNKPIMDLRISPPRFTHM